ncbi:MAG: FAD-binding domain [Bacteriovoracia bacterium]
MNILISGAGIAGPTLAYWLKKYGFKPTLVEKSPVLRTGGYVVDFWGLGFDVAEKMGILPQLKKTGYQVKEIRILDKNGKKSGGFSAEVFGKLTNGRYLSIPRGELASTIYSALDGSVETIFGEEISEISQTKDCVQVKFSKGTSREFDLVIGADGLHSKVRQIVFGPQENYEKYLGYKVAAFEIPEYRPRQEDVYVMYTEIGQQIGRFSMKNDMTMFLFVFVDKNKGDPSHSIEIHRKILHERFSNSGWETKTILEKMDTLPDLYFDRVSQIRMNQWSDGRVCLLGDAAFCVSLLAGQGSALAMTAAYILAGELHLAKGDYKKAFSQYQNIFSPFVLKKQKAAEKFAGSFAPSSAFGLFIRNQVTKLLSISLIAELALGSDLRDKIELPNYGG